MRRTTTSAQNRGRSSGRAVEPASVSAALVDAWWGALLAGDVDKPHPVYGDLKAHLDGGRLRLSGELETESERTDLVRQARERIGHGIDRVDVSHLNVQPRKEKPGILRQTLISAFPNLAAAKYARAFVLKHSRVAPLREEIVDSPHANNLTSWRPEEFLRDAGKALDEGGALLILQVDETAAFRVRELLEEDTRSDWTIALPPELMEPDGRA
jgi:hypothetical protein